MLDKYRNAHIDRVIEATDDLFLKHRTICKKCHVIHGDMNCIFCYCPNYDDFDCGGNYIIMENGLKDCSNCLKPHQKEFVREQLMKLYL
jgi:Zn-finger protein